MAAPIGIEYLSFKKDKEKKISFARFRIVIYTFIYFIGITVALFFLKEIILWIESLSFVEWITEKVAIDGEAAYLAKLLIVIALNVAIGVLYLLFGKFVKTGLEKKCKVFINKLKTGQNLSVSEEKQNKILNFFRKETWFFAGKIIKYLSFTLSAAYALVFVLYLIPALSDAGWIPYDFISMLFSAGYNYPILTLLVLWEAYFFLEGIEYIDKECPDILEPNAELDIDAPIEGILAADEAVHNDFRDFYVNKLDVSQACNDETVSDDHKDITKLIATAIENDERNPQLSKEVYLDCIDKLCESEEKSALINGTFFSEFSMYLIRYLSVILARGDNIAFICNNDEQVEEVYNYLNEGYSELYSIHCDDIDIKDVSFDNPIWKIVKVSGENDAVESAAVDDSSILVTTLAYLSSAEFNIYQSKFIRLLDTVVFVDTLKTINTYNRQLITFNTKLTNITRNSALDSKNKNKNKDFSVRYMSKQVRYICFDDSRLAAIDKALQNMLGVEFVSLDSMRYNKGTMVRCYNYESFPDDAGERIYQSVPNIEETVGSVMSMAVTCSLTKAPNVTVFANETFPYAEVQEIISANMARLPGLEKPPHVNEKYYNPDKYAVAIVVDGNNNLPTAIRRYVSMASDKQTLILLISRPYMMRDYYLANIDNLWNTQIERIPVADSGDKGFAQAVLVKADAGGVSEEEIFSLAASYPSFAEEANNRDVNAILRKVLEIYDLKENFYDYFEFTTTRDFDENGNYKVENKVHLKQSGHLSDMINGRDMIRMINERGKSIPLSLPKSRLTQNYIAGQNLLHNGKIYNIKSIDVERGYIYANRSMGGKNEEPYEYIQKRKYRVEFDEDKMEPLLLTKQATFKENNTDENVRVEEVSVSAFKAPMEVITNGFYVVDPHTYEIDTSGYQNINDMKNKDTKRALQTYRRYGNLEKYAYSSEIINQTSDWRSKGSGAIMMCINIKGQFGEDVNKTMALAASMLNELIHSMFPSVADAVAVCPVFHSELSGDDAEQALKTLPIIDPDTSKNQKSPLWSNTDFTLLVIEDCTTDLGVVSALMTSGEDVLDILFDPITDYLNWYLKSDKPSTYLHYGLDHAPSCFDFESLYRLSKLVGDEKSKRKFINVDTIAEHESCDFCEKRYAKSESEIDVLRDSRKMCKACAATIVGSNKKALEAHLNGAKIFLESTYGISLDDYDVIFESTVKIVNTLKQNPSLIGLGSDVPLKSYVDEKYRIHVEYDIPSINLSELLVRELTHVWQMKNLKSLPKDIAEGQIALVTVQYLKSLNKKRLARARTNYYESTSSVSGEGYRRLVRELLGQTKYRNNSFIYLCEINGGAVSDVIVPQTPQAIQVGDDAVPYIPEAPDRTTGGITYFYYPRLPANKKRVYDAMLEAINNHEPSLTVEGFAFDDISNVSRALKFDHPELFWYNTFSMCGDVVTFDYGVGAEEAKDIQGRMDIVIPSYLEGITNEMSAYDVALRIHAKVISSVDYDSIALDRQEKTGGPKDGEIDYLRTICGPFLNNSAVCVGYARAMQYLLQKCGIECAEATGHTIRENGSLGCGHAWNIVKIDGDYYYLDATWDDSSDTIQSVKSNELGFDYFCITTEEISRTRLIDTCPTEMPECKSLKANYYYYNNLVIDTYDLNMIKAIAIAAVEKDKKSFTFKCKTEAVFDEALNKLCTSVGDCFEVLKAAAKYNKTINASTFTHSNDKNIYTITISFKYK